MEILSHRGFWQDKRERNERIAFERSFDLGLGTETDLRDHNGEIVIAHDMPEGSPMTFAELLRIMDGRNLTLALNVKADGMASRIKTLLKDFNHTNYFVFDMSVPDLVRQIAEDMIVFTGLSDIQPVPVLLENCAGVWLDCFRDDWYGPGLVDGLLSGGKRVCIVSSDLHGRDIAKQWNILKSMKRISSKDVLLCTDMPIEAMEFFKGAAYEN